MRRVNVNEIECVLRDEDPPAGYRGDVARVGEQIGASMMTATVRELPPGESVCPYHYEHGDEEWMLVLEGAPSVRDPDGVHELRTGDMVCFPAGPPGAHKISNHSAQSARILIFSTHNFPAVVVYPDSDKIGVYTEDESDDLLVRREDGVDYWVGEPPPGA
jgi:uncharacterized cupin superfamily protein